MSQDALCSGGTLKTPLSSADSLGPVWGVHIWHDNSGPFPSWNIKHLDVSEVSRGQLKGRAWLFVAQCWLAVNQSDGRVERILGKCTRGIGFFKLPFQFGCVEATAVSVRTGVLSVCVVLPAAAVISFLFRQKEAERVQLAKSRTTGKDFFQDDFSVSGSISEPHLSWSVLQLWAQDTWRKKYQVTLALSSHSARLIYLFFQSRIYDITDYFHLDIARALKRRHSSVLQFRAHKSTDSAMDRTKSDQSNKETSHSQDDESVLQFDAETVKLLVMRGDELYECVTICEERYDALEERYSALEEEMEAKEARHKQQLDENLVTINLLKRREEELLQSQEKSTKDLAEKQQSWESGKQGMKYVVDKTNYQAARNHTLETEKQKMECKVKGVMKHNTQQTFRIHTLEKEVQKLVLQLENQGEKISADQQPMETKQKEVSQEKDDLAKMNLSCEIELKQVEAKLKQVEKENEDLAKKNKSWETDVKQLKDQMREKEEKFSKDLAEEHLSWETQLKQVEAKCKQVEKQKNHLAKKNKSWETDVQQLKDKMREQEEKFSEDLAEKHLSWESEKHQLEDERREMESTLKQVEESKKKLAEENHSLELDVTLNVWLVKQFEKDMEVLEEKFSRQHQSWETKVSSMETEIKEVTQEKEDLVQKLQSQATEFKEIQAQLHQAEDENNLSWETKVQQLEEEMKEQKEKCSKDLTQKHQSWETTVHLMETQLKQAKEEKDDLTQTRLSWEAKEKKMEDEKTLLEDLCLHMKNKSRGFFARRRATEERDAILQKMLRKMQEKEMGKKAKGEKEEKEEAGRQ
ncbi:hypothetical protein NQZ68_035093 [Dissostichus eleginoides]|nr:hypothetical protein NQZ68_035093 [Dissostichus eleginoides]